MGRKKSRNLTLPVVDGDGNKQKPAMGRRRAIVLVLVHVVILAHIGHYLVSGSTLTPLEPSEGSYTLREGLINAGAVFFCLLILSTLVFGRFFCGWACHVVAYQDLARWLLIKLGIRPKPVRARLLMLVPLFAAYWLYGRPIVERLLADESGHASYVLHLTTDDFWRTFPGPGITILTVLVCGFLIVYFLGSKGFCTYGCPYGAFFGVADKAAPGRIRVTDACDGSSRCTANCSSNVDVAREVRLYGKVVDPGCMKCMDCITVCPNDALYFGFTSRVEREPVARELRRRHYDFSWGEELLLVALFAGTFLIYKNLYGVVPLLLAVGLSSITAYLLLMATRLAYQRRLSIQNWRLKREGRWGRGGRAYAAAAGLLVLFLAHSGVVRWHAWRGQAAFETAHAARLEGDRNWESAALMAQAHLSTCQQWGLFSTRTADRKLGHLALLLGEPVEAERHIQRAASVDRFTPDLDLLLGRARLAQGDRDAARPQIEAALDDRALTAERYVQIAAQLRREGDGDAALEVLRIGAECHPDAVSLVLACCKSLVRPPRGSAGHVNEAIERMERAVAMQEADEPRLLATLARLHSLQGRWDAAIRLVERARHAAEARGPKEMLSDLYNARAYYLEQRNLADENGAS